MKFTLSWLKTYLDTDASLDAITDKLTAIGLEIEEVENPADALAPFIVAEIISAEQHPNADRLQVCMVNTGSETIQVVCGAPNARKGLKGAFAPNGAIIPTNGMKLKPTKIRDVESNGMMCSERELGLGEDHDGIIDLPADAPVGEKFAAYAKLDDPVIEIAITPNRQDALGVFGIARDLAAAGMGTLIQPDTTEIKGSYPSPVKIHIENTDACPVFAGRYIRGVKNGPSPEWLQRRLKALGMKSISALVDMTNFMSFDLARPLHVFDADKLQGDITVRLAETGEKFAALDGKEYVLNDEVCAVTDDSGVIGLGGVMGGEETGCSEDTINVFVECAYFDPIRTAMTGRKLGIESDARYRFERGVDPETVLSGIEVATRLILDMCGGEASEVYVAGGVPDISKTVQMRPERVKELGGVDVEKTEIIQILEKLGFKVSEDGALLNVTSPSWRIDIDGEADLVEEVLRIHGFEHITGIPLPKSSREIVTGLSPLQRRLRAAKRAAGGRGLREAVTWSFLPSEQAKLFGDLSPSLVLENPISADLDAMRPNLLPNLLCAAGRNADRGFKNVALFEAGSQFSSDTPDGQSLVLAGVRRGQNGPRHWQKTPEDVNVFDVKADAQAILRAMGGKINNAQVVAEAPAWYHPGRSGTLRLGPKNILAYFGEIHPAILKKLGLSGPHGAFEILIENLPLPKSSAGNNRGPLKVSDFQAVERDFAFVVDQDVKAADLIRALTSVDKNLVDEVSLFDIYQGKGVEDGKKSIALNVRLQPRTATLTDAEIETFSQKAIAAAAKSTGAILR